MAALNQKPEPDEHDTPLPETQPAIKQHEPSVLRPPSTAPEIISISQPTEEDSVDAIIDHPTSEDKNLSDPEVDHVITDIERTDADKVLDADAPLAAAVVMKPKLHEHIMEVLRNIWEDPKKRYGTLGGILLLIIIIAAIPATRSFALNTLGVRANVSVTVLDGTNNLPLQGAMVTLGGQPGLTNTKGMVTLSHVRLGSEPLQVEKRAFANFSKQVSINMGSHTLPSVVIRAIGTQFTFTMTDYVSGKVVADAEVTSGDASAVTDKTGKAVLTVQPTSATTLSINISASDYRTEND